MAPNAAPLAALHTNAPTRCGSRSSASALGLAQPEREQRRKQGRSARQEKHPPPTVMVRDPLGDRRSNGVGKDARGAAQTDGLAELLRRREIGGERDDAVEDQSVRDA